MNASVDCYIIRTENGAKVACDAIEQQWKAAQSKVAIAEPLHLGLQRAETNRRMEKPYSL